MTWNNLPNLAHEQLVVESHLDQIRENIEHLGAVQLAGTAVSALAMGTSAARLATGVYTGNGNPTQAITNLGFQPKFLLVWYTTSNANYRAWFKSANSGIYARTMSDTIVEADHIISLDSGGFTVGDGTGSGYGQANQLNVNGNVYHYVALG